MSSEDGEVYIMCDGDEEGDWVRPVPASQAIVEAVTEASGLEADDIDDVEAYVDREDLRAVLDSSSADIEFDVEDATVTLSAQGEISVE